MIASHNTFTFMRARKWWARLLTPWWRCQISEYGAKSATMWDIRIRRQSNGAWTLCHGRIDLGAHPICSDLTDLLNTLGVPFDKKVRVVLERGSENDRQLFRNWALGSTDRRLAGTAIKNPWEWVQYDSIPEQSCYYKPWDSGLTLRGNLRRWIHEPRTLFSTIRCTARRWESQMGTHRADPKITYWHDRL